MFTRLLFLVVTLCVILSPIHLSAQSPSRFIVNDINDDANSRDAQAGDGECLDANGRCTLRAAIDEANATSGEVIIVLPGRVPGGNSGTYTLSRVAPNMMDNTFEDANAYGDLDIGGSFSKLTIQGTATPGPEITISPNDRVLDIKNGAEVVITRVHVTGGTANPGNNGNGDGSGVGVDGEDGANGGGIRVGQNAKVTLDQVAITGNFTSSGGNGAAPASSISRTAGGDGGAGGNGGGLYVSTGAVVNLRRAVITGNGTGDGGSGASGQANMSAADGGRGGDGGNGGGVYNAGTLNVFQSTIYNNTAGSPSGGAGGVNGGADGAAGEGGSGAGIANARIVGGSLTSEGTVVIANTIVAGNTPGDDNQNGKQPGVDLFDANDGATFTSSGNNLIGNNEGASNLMSGSNDQIGTPSSVIDPVITGINQNQDFAIPVPILGSGSPAIDAGSSNGNFDYDGRGFIRPDDGGVADIGAYEAGSRDTDPELLIVEIDVVASTNNREFVEIKNTGNYPVQMDDHVLVGFNSSAQACFAANLYGQLEPGKLFTVGDPMVTYDVEQFLDFDVVTGGNCGSGMQNEFVDDNGAVALYEGEGGNFTSFMAGDKEAEREDVIVYDNTPPAGTGGGTSSRVLDLCSAFNLGSGCAGDDEGDDSSIQRDQNGNLSSGTPSPGQENANNLLPVTWISFVGYSPKAGAVDLKWEVAAEENNVGFAVEHLTDAGDWEESAWVEGRGDYAGQRSYTARLEGIPAGLRNFRLRQLDFDGTIDHSTTIAVRVSGGAEELKVFPNPVSDRLTLGFATQSRRPVEVLVYDARGSEVTSQRYTPAGNGWERAELDMGALAPGYYTVLAITAEGSRTARVLKR